MLTKINRMVILSVATFAIAGLLLSCGSTSDVVTPSTGDASDSEKFQLSDLVINPEEVATRDEVVITAEVTNRSGAEGTYEAELKVNDVTEASDKVLVPAGQSQPVTFVLFKDKPGTYKVSLGTLGGQFVVSEPVLAGSSSSGLGQAGSCCTVGKSTLPPTQQGSAGCCGGATTQTNPITQPGRTSGCCGR